MSIRRLAIGIGLSLLAVGCTGPRGSTVRTIEPPPPATARVIHVVTNGHHTLASSMPSLATMPDIDPGQVLLAYRTDRSARTLYATSSRVETRILLPEGWTIDEVYPPDDGLVTRDGVSGIAGIGGWDELDSNEGLTETQSISDDRGSTQLDGLSGQTSAVGTDHHSSVAGKIARRHLDGLDGQRSTGGRAGSESAVGPPQRLSIAGLAGYADMSGRAGSESQLPRATVHKSSIPEDVRADRPWRYLITVHNHSEHTFIHAILYDHLPLGLELGNLPSSSQLTGRILSFVVADSNQSLLPGESRSFEFTVSLPIPEPKRPTVTH
ncbi:MAG TPA: hypothetical protein PKE55_01645 [Kiritimatiellia bacterium]|nr:hypothetical protein [Kiritimatiellia bacterium]